MRTLIRIKVLPATETKPRRIVYTNLISGEQTRISDSSSETLRRIVQTDIGANLEYVGSDEYYLLDASKPISF